MSVARARLQGQRFLILFNRLRELALGIVRCAEMHLIHDIRAADSLRSLEFSMSRLGVSPSAQYHPGIKPMRPPKVRLQSDRKLDFVDCFIEMPLQTFEVSINR